MAKKSLTKNYIYNLVYQVLVIILPLITTPYVSRVLGAKNLGIYSYTVSISALFILFGSLGVALYGQREIAYQQEDKDSRSRTFYEIVLFRFITLLISLATFYVTFVRGSADYGLYYKILMLEIIGNAFDISWFFMGLEDFKKTVGRNLLVKLISVASIFIFVRGNGDLSAYYWIYVLSILIGNISLWFYLPKYVDRVKLRSLNVMRHLRPTIGLFVPQIAVQVYTILDKTMIGTIIEDKSEVAYFDQAQKIVKLLLTLITSLGTVMMPRIAATFAKGNKEKVTSYMKKSFRLVFLLSFPLIFGVIAVSNNFVPIFFGKGYDEVAMLMGIISPIILLIGLSNVTGTQYLLPTKRQREYTLSVVYGSIVNVIVNLLLIHRFGAIGASIGTVVAELTVTGVQIYYTRNDFDWQKIIRLSGKYLLYSLVMFACCLLVGIPIKRKLVALVAQIVTGVLVYGVILLHTKDDVMLSVLVKVKKMLRIG